MRFRVELRAAVRATGNATFVAFALPFLLPPLANRRGWSMYLGAHAVHAAHLVAWRLRGGAFGGMSRYGGAVGYATIAALGFTGYAPGTTPPARSRVWHLHHTGERLLFGLYSFTIVHGYLAKGRQRGIYGPLAAVWLAAAARGRAVWTRPDVS
jgi:hypothetical protein